MSRVILILSVLAAIFVPTSLQAQTTRLVPSTYPTIQAAIDASSNGDSVLVAAGTYRESINFRGKAIRVESASGAETTIIDGGGTAAVVRFATNETSDAILRGFTIQSGRSTVFSEAGGIVINRASPKILGNRIINNVPCGISASASNALIQGNVVSGNHGGCGAGASAIYLADPSAPQLVGNNIYGNTATDGSFPAAVILWYASGAIVQDNVISNNSGSYGGLAIFNNKVSVQIVQNVISANTGGGVYWDTPPAVFSHNTVADNVRPSGGSALVAGFYSPVTAVISDNIFTARSGTSVVLCFGGDSYPPGIATFTNNLVYGLGIPAYANYFSGFPSCNATGVRGNIAGDPRFAAPDVGNYHLKSGSPAIDAGVSLSSTPSSDREGRGRVNGSSVDIGASEFTNATSFTGAPASLVFPSQQFGTVSPSQDVTLVNTGTTTLDISSITLTGDFRETDTCRVAAGVAPGASCVIHVMFAPASRGSLSGTLTIASNTSPSETEITLSGTSPGPVVTLSVTEVAFSGQGVGTTSAAQSIVLSNMGDTALSITSIQATGDFSTTQTCGASVAVGGSCRIDITFRPTIRGTRYGMITIADNAPGNPRVITTYGIGLSAIVSLSQYALQFGSQAVGTSSAPQVVLLTNRGDFPLTVTRDDISGDFSEGSDCLGTLAPNATCHIHVIFSPGARGQRQGVVTITHDGPGSPHTISLSGTGTAPTITFFPAFVTFGNQLVSATSLERTLSVRNSGDGPLVISSLQTTSAQFAATSDCLTTLPPNANCTVRLTFTPTQLGGVSGSVRIVSNVPGNLSSATVSGTGVNVVLTPSALSFSSTLIGQPTSLPALLGNNTGSPLNISAIAVTGSGFSQSNDCPAQLPSGSTCIINVLFTPASAVSYSGTLTVTDSGAGSPRTVTLSGSGGTPAASLVRSTTFGAQLVGTSSPGQRFGLSSGGTAPLTLFSITTSGDFSSTNDCPTVLQPLVTCTITVVFAPSRAGAHTGAVTVVDNAPGSPHTLVLNGTAVTTLPAPTITSINPSAAPVGAAAVTLTVSGSNFAPNAVVRWNGADRPTTFGTSTSLSASIPATDLSAFGSAEVTVYNPLDNGALSNGVSFTVYDGIPVFARDLVYDPISRKIYASVPATSTLSANTITPIDPATRSIETPITIGSDPSKLAVSDNGQYLYAALDGSGSVRRMALTTRTPGQEFFLGNDDVGNRPYQANDMEVIPGNAGVVAISRRRVFVSPSFGGVVIYDNGIARPTVTPSHTGSDIIELSGDSTILYGMSPASGSRGLRTMAVNSSGISETNLSLQDLISGVDMRFDSGRLYTTSGDVMDPVNRTLLGRFPVSFGTGIAVTADARMGLTFVLSTESGSLRVSAYNQRSFTLVGTALFADVINSASASYGSLVRWGDDGLVFRANNLVITMRIPQSWTAAPASVFSIADRGGRSVASYGTSTSIVSGYSRIVADSGSTTSFGIAIFGYRPGNYLVSETGVPAVRPLQSGRIYVETGSGVNIGLAIANPNNSAVTINFYYTNTSGVDVGTASTTIGANRQIATFIDASPLKTFSGTTFQGTLSFTSTQPVGVTAIRSLTNARGDFLMSTLPVVDTTVTSTAVAVVPHFADGGGWSTQVLLVNPTSNTLTGTIEFRDPTGAPVAVAIAGSSSSSFPYSIPPRTSQRLTAGGGTGALKSGSIRVTPGSGQIAPVPQASFAYQPGAVVLSHAGVGAVSSTLFRAYVESSGTPGAPGNIQSGLAIANSGAAPVSVSVDLTGLDGASTGYSATFSIPAFGQRANFLSELFAGSALPQTLQGILRISASSPVSVVGLRAHYNELGDFLITTTPPSDETAAPGSGDLLIPQFADGGGYTTQFILFTGSTGQTSSGALRFTNTDGQAITLPLH